MNQCVYNLKWYDFTVREQRSMLPILQRNLRPVGLSAVGYFSCNLVTFHWVSAKWCRCKSERAGDKVMLTGVLYSTECADCNEGVLGVHVHAELGVMNELCDDANIAEIYYDSIYSPKNGLFSVAFKLINSQVAQI